MYSEETDLPGGNDFVDVTAIFAGAVQRTLFTSFLYMITRKVADLDATEMIFADGYSLNDAMSALEVWRSTSIHASWSTLTPEQDWGTPYGQRDGSRRSAAPTIRPAGAPPAGRGVLDSRPLDLVRGK